MQAEHYNQKREKIKRASLFALYLQGLVILQIKFVHCISKAKHMSTKERINNYGSTIPSWK